MALSIWQPTKSVLLRPLARSLIPKLAGFEPACESATNC
jgi:hypothetical protein